MLLSDAAAGSFALGYIGKVCCSLLVIADYIGPRPGPEGTGNRSRLGVTVAEVPAA